MSDLSNEIKRLKNLKQNKNRDSQSIENEAKVNVYKKNVDIAGRFAKAEDKKLAEKIFDSYIENYNFETYTDYVRLGDLVFERVLKEKLQSNLVDINKDETNKFISDKTVKALHDTIDKIHALEENLGITKVEKKDDLSALEQLKKKFRKWILFNRNECTLYMPFKCSECGKEDVQPILLRRRVKDFDVVPHPFFLGRFSFSVEMFHDLEQGLISEEQVARYLRTSVRYIQWCKENMNKIVESNGFTREEINDFIDNIPFLQQKYKESHNIS